MGTNAIKPCRVFSLRPSVSICSVSAKNVHFGASLTWTILTTSLQPFWALKMSVALLSMPGQKDLEFHTKYLNLCSLRVLTVWNYIINDNFHVLGVNYPFDPKKWNKQIHKQIIQTSLMIHWNDLAQRMIPSQLCQLTTYIWTFYTQIFDMNIVHKSHEWPNAFMVLLCYISSWESVCDCPKCQRFILYSQMSVNQLSWFTNWSEWSVRESVFQ